MSIADQITAEHHLDDFYTCVCDEERRLPAEHARHVAEVTEKAVRAQIAADIEVEQSRADRVPFAGGPSPYQHRADVFALAADIARGGA